MRLIYIISFLISGMLFISCEKYESNTFDFSNSLHNFVEFKSAADMKSKAAGVVKFTVITKSSLFKDTKVDVKFEGNGSNETKTLTLSKMKTSVEDSFTIPASAAKDAIYNISIISAKSDNEDLRIGRIDDKTTKIKITIE